jgi:starch synthase
MVGKTPMDVLMVTGELAPYSRATRAADAVAALSKALCQLDHRVTVVAPRHPGYEAQGLLAARRLTPLKLDGGVQVTVLDAQLPTGATLVLLDTLAALDRSSKDAEIGGRLDDLESLGLFCKAVVALTKQRGDRSPPFDIVHLNDWATASIAAGIRALPDAPATVLTVHDGLHRGIVSPEELRLFGSEGSGVSYLEAPGASLLALGARSADAVVTMSPACATDLLDVGKFGALARALMDRPDPPTGILGGLDYAIWNPATDSALRSRYDAEDPANKGSNKVELQRSFGLDIDPERPLVAAIVESSAGSGLEVLESALPAFAKNDLSFVAFVRGDAEIGRRIGATIGSEPDRFAVTVSNDDALARRACAGADLLLLPALYDESALWARAAQRYGALPVALARGAHVDAIVDCDADLETGTGFLYDEATKESLLAALARGLAACASPRLRSLRRRVMRLDLGWDRPARRYVQVYRQAATARSSASDPRQPDSEPGNP